MSYTRHSLHAAITLMQVLCVEPIAAIQALPGFTADSLGGSLPQAAHRVQQLLSWAQQELLGAHSLPAGL